MKTLEKPKAGSPRARLSQLIAEGIDCEAAAERILGELPEEWRGWVGGFVLREARAMEGTYTNRRRREVFAGSAMSMEADAEGSLTEAQLAYREDLRKMEAGLNSLRYHLPDGTTVRWGELTLDLIEVKIAALKKHIAGTEEHLVMLEASRKLIIEYDVEKISDVPNWVEKVRETVVQWKAERES